MLRKSSLALLAYTVFVIIGGAYVRATFSGDGCADHWPWCDGEVVPTAPSLKKMIEYTHRVTSGLGWFAAATFLLVARRLQKRSTQPDAGLVKYATWTLVLYTTEALVGAGLVVFKKVAHDTSTARAWWMGSHLLNTFLLLAVLMLLVRAAYGRRPISLQSSDRSTVAVALIALIAVAITGSVAALGATLFPADSLRAGIAHDFATDAPAIVRLRFFHPIVALLGSGIALVCATRLGRSISDTAPRSSTTQPPGSRAAFLAIVAVSANVILGMLNLALHAPVFTQLSHLFLADVVWCALVFAGAEAMTPATT